jgi:hypothetical protein
MALMHQPGVQRLWSLMRGDQECIGLIMHGHVPGYIDDPDTAPVLGLVDFAQLGKTNVRLSLEGQMTISRDVIENSSEAYGWRCLTVEEALAWLDAEKARLLVEGWFETSLDPVDLDDD